MSRLTVEYRTIVAWPDPETPESERLSQHTFKAKAFETQQQLAYEAERLDASDLVVEIVGSSELFYRDGTGIRADRASKVAHVGVIVHLIGTRFGDLRYACDTFNGWEANLRAVALGLEALRRVERYGIARRGEQYQGWAALPPGTPMGTGRPEVEMSLLEAAGFLAAAIDGLTAQDVLNEPEDARTAYRLASKRLHPDNLHTGSHESFLRLEAAWRIVQNHQP